jgi:hypothetical protein
MVDLDTAKKVTEQTLLQAQNLLRKNKFLEPIFLALTEENVDQDWAQMEVGTFEGFKALIEKHLDTSEAMVMIFQSIARDLNKIIPPTVDITEDKENYKCLVCVVHTKETTLVLQSVYAEENGDYVFIDTWEPILKGSGSIFDNPYLEN